MPASYAQACSIISSSSGTGTSERRKWNEISESSGFTCIFAFKYVKVYLRNSGLHVRRPPFSPPPLALGWCRTQRQVSPNAMESSRARIRDALGFISKLLEYLFLMIIQYKILNLPDICSTYFPSQNTLAVNVKYTNIYYYDLL